jgi:hypothetical protein
MRLDLKRRLVAALLLATTGATTAMAAGSGVDTMGDPNFYTSYRLITYTAGFGQFDISSHDEAVNGETFVYTSIGQLWNGQVANQNAVVTNNGATYWTNSMGPTLTSTPAPDTPVGSITSVLVEQSFVKTSADAQLSFTYTGGLLQLYRDVEARPPCVAGCAYADVAWRVEVVINSAPELELMHETGRAAMAIQDDTFKLFVSQSALDGTPVNPLWNWGCTRCGTSPAYGLAAATLDAPYTGIVDLSSIPFDPAFPPIEFTVRFWLDTTTNINEPYVGATAWAKDPLSFGDSAGVGLTVQGLLPTNNAISAVPEPAAWLLLVLGVPVLLRRRQLTQGDCT